VGGGNDGGHSGGCLLRPGSVEHRLRDRFQHRRRRRVTCWEAGRTRRRGGREPRPAASRRAQGRGAEAPGRVAPPAAGGDADATEPAPPPAPPPATPPPQKKLLPPQRQLDGGGEGGEGWWLRGWWRGRGRRRRRWRRRGPIPTDPRGGQADAMLAAWRVEAPASGTSLETRGGRNNAATAESSAEASETHTTAFAAHSTALRASPSGRRRVGLVPATCRSTAVAAPRRRWRRRR